MATYEEQQSLLRSLVPTGTPAATELASQGYKDVGVNIPASSVGPVNQINLPETPTGTDYASILAGLNGSLPPEPSTTEKETTRADIATATTELGGASAFKAEQEKVLGLDVTKRQEADLQAQLQSVNAEAIAANLEVGRIGRPAILTSAANLEKANIERDRTIKALRLSASIGALQGKISLATDQVQRAVDLKYDPIKAKLETLNKQLDYNYQDFNAAEKKRADALKAKNDLQLKQLEINRANEKDKNATLLNQMQSYPDAGITFNDTVETANEKITTTSKIYAEKIKPSGGTDVFTTTQNNKGAAVAGLTIADFNNLDIDSKI